MRKLGWVVGGTMAFVALGSCGSSPMSGASDQESPPFFPLILYCADTPEDFPEFVQAGFTVVQNYCFEGDDLSCQRTGLHNTNDDVERYLNAARAAGLKVLLGTYDWSSSSDNWLVDEERIRRFKDHPALYGWQLFDEVDAAYDPQDPHRTPCGFTICPDELAAAYKKIKAIDPHHPVSVAAVSPDGLGLTSAGRSFPRGYDLVMPDTISWVPLAQGHSAYVHYLSEAFERLTPLGKSIINHVTVNLGHDPYPEGPLRYPTKEELRFMAYHSLMRGSRGIAILCYRFNYSCDYYYPDNPSCTPTDPWTLDDSIDPIRNPTQWAAVSRVVSELKAMSPILLAPTQDPQEAGVTLPEDAGIEGVVKQSQGKTYLFTANPSAEPVTLQIWLDPERFFHSTITRLPDRQRIVSEEADFSPAFTEKWEPYEVRLYEIAPQASGKLRVCPDEWIENHMPRVVPHPGEQRFPAQYFIIDGVRRELEEFDVEWVQEHCAIQPQRVE